MRRILPCLALIATAFALSPATGGPTSGPVEVLGFGHQAASIIPPFIDATDGIAPLGTPWGADPANWMHSATITVRGAQYGQPTAMVKLRIEGKGDPVNTSSPQQTMLVYDNSGSMSTNDPSGLRCPAMQYYIDQLRAPSEIGAVMFESTAVIQSGLTTDYAPVKAALDCQNLGATNQHDALRLANDETIPKNKSNFVKAHILITDGNWNQGGDPQPQVDRAAANSIRLFTICLGGNCNIVEMQSWSAQTKGAFFNVANASDLQKVFDAITIAISNDVAGRPPKTGVPMVRFQLRTGIEVASGSFRCESVKCADPLPASRDPIPGNDGLRLEWNAPVPVLRIKEYWQVSFGVRSYVLGQQIRVNEVGSSYVEYDRYDGSAGGSDTFEQLYVDVAPDIPGIVEVGLGEPPQPPPPPPHGGIPQLIPQPQQVPMTYIQNLPVLHGMTQVQGIPLQYILGSVMGMAVADRVKVKSRIRQGVKLAISSM